MPLRAFVSLFVLLYAALLTEHAGATTLVDLDRILTRAPNVEAFLNNQPLIDEYYEALADYYGTDKLSRKSYDAILNQLREVRKKVPEIDERLWEVPELQNGFSLNIDVKTSGLDIKPDEWSRYLEEMRKQTAEKCGALCKKGFSDQMPIIQKTLDEAEDRIKKFEASQAALPKSQKAERAARAKQFYQKEIFDTPNFREVSALLFQGEVFYQPNLDVLRSGDADSVLGKLDELKETKGFRSRPDVVIDPSVRSLIFRSEMPEVELPKLQVLEDPETKVQTAAESKFFRVKTFLTRRKKLIPEGSVAKGAVEFIPLPRRFHGLMKGVPLGECVGGNCQSLNMLSPERWATSVLKDSQIYSVQRGSSYQGFVQVVPMAHEKDIIVSLDLGSPVLAKQTLSGNQRVSVYSHFIKKLREVVPKKWKNFVLSEGGAIDNAGVLPIAHRNPSFQFSRTIAPSEIQHIDPMAAKIVAASPKSSAYGGNMILDATANADEPLHIVREALAQKDVSKLATEEFLMRALAISDARLIQRALEAINKANGIENMRISEGGRARLIAMLSEPRFASRLGSLLPILERHPPMDAENQRALLQFLKRVMTDHPADNAAYFAARYITKLGLQTLPEFRTEVSALYVDALRPGRYDKSHNYVEMLFRGTTYEKVLTEEARAAIARHFFVLKPEHRELNRQLQQVLRNQGIESADVPRQLLRETLEIARKSGGLTDFQTYPVKLMMRPGYLTLPAQDLAEAVNTLAALPGTMPVMEMVVKDKAFDSSLVTRDARKAIAKTVTSNYEKMPLELLAKLPLSHPDDELGVLKDIRAILDRDGFGKSWSEVGIQLRLLSTDAAHSAQMPAENKILRDGIIREMLYFDGDIDKINRSVMDPFLTEEFLAREPRAKVEAALGKVQSSPYAFIESGTSKAIKAFLTGTPCPQEYSRLKP